MINLFQNTNKYKKKKKIKENKTKQGKTYKGEWNLMSVSKDSKFFVSILQRSMKT